MRCLFCWWFVTGFGRIAFAVAACLRVLGGWLTVNGYCYAYFYL